MSFLALTSLATGMILKTAYMRPNIEKTSPRQSTLKFGHSNFIALEESLGTAAYMANNVKRKEEYREIPCILFYRTIVPPISEAYPYVRSSSDGIQVATLQEGMI